MRALDEYRQMLNEAKLTALPVKNLNLPNLVRQMKGKFRYFLDRFGVVTRKNANFMRCGAISVLTHLIILKKALRAVYFWITPILCGSTKLL